MRILATIFAALLLAACGTVPRVNEGLAQINAKEDQASEEVATLKAFTLNDIANARVIAKKYDDQLAVHCYDALTQYLGGVDTDIGRAAGAVSAYQKARVARRFVDRGLPDDVRIWCGALVADSRQTLLGIAGRLGVRVAVP